MLQFPSAEVRLTRSWMPLVGDRGDRLVGIRSRVRFQVPQKSHEVEATTLSSTTTTTTTWSLRILAMNDNELLLYCTNPHSTLDRSVGDTPLCVFFFFFFHFQSILGTYTAVGILEHWDLSMQLFDARVRSPVRDWVNISKSNPGKLSPVRDEVTRWAHLSPEIHRVLATDMLLYDYAMSVFKLQTSATLGTVWE